MCNLTREKVNRTDFVKSKHSTDNKHCPIHDYKSFIRLYKKKKTKEQKKNRRKTDKRAIQSFIETS